MKKFTKIAVVMALGVSLLVVGCGKTAAPATSNAGVKLYQGMGTDSVFRVKVDKATQKESYSTNTVIANAIFDANGKIVSVQFDTLEIVPESTKASATVFPGWPTETLKKDVITKNVADWKTKRERGDKEYGMNWSVQMNAYQDFFKGKTVAEIEAWYAKSTSDLNGKPLTDKMADPKDKEKFGKLTDAEKKALADVTSGASISLNDDHGNFVKALKEAFQNKVEVTVK